MLKHRFPGSTPKLLNRNIWEERAYLIMLSFKQLGLWRHKDLTSHHSVARYCVTLGKLFNLSQFSGLQNRGNTYLILLLQIRSTPCLINVHSVPWSRVNVQYMLVIIFAIISIKLLEGQSLQSGCRSTTGLCLTGLLRCPSIASLLTPSASVSKEEPTDLSPCPKYLPGQSSL